MALNNNVDVDLITRGLIVLTLKQIAGVSYNNT